MQQVRRRGAPRLLVGSPHLGKRHLERLLQGSVEGTGATEDELTCEEALAGCSEYRSGGAENGSEAQAE